MAPQSIDPVGPIAPTVVRSAPRDRAADWALLLFAVLTLTLAGWWNVSTDRLGVPQVRAGSVTLPPICLLRSLTGRPCATCGMTRSFVSAAHGEWAPAAIHHPLGPVAFLLTVLQIPYRAFVLFTDSGARYRCPEAWAGRMFWSFAAALLVTWMIRLCS